MPIQDYGVWKGRPVSYEVDPPHDRSPHINLVFTGDGPRKLKAAINVKSQTKPHELVYWFDRNFSHPLTLALVQLDYGFQAIEPDDSQTMDLALDYVRTPDILQLQEGRILPFIEDGPDNDILDQLQPILDDAIQQKADIYLYGSSFGPGGIHEVHMNQGSTGFDNGVRQDGGFLLRFADGRWAAVFLAFASQRIPTDDTSGEPLPGSQSRSLKSIIESRGRARL
ncbi:hypothetical protein PV05_10148 [Exophiala xenobiotica]|uniref:DUF2278 domain-containing protein n=1 Tax=Exophiala xenobiotica TaxID=348802 RepID=A0A0D2E7J5_9EURO|nr:uncharacterized protein PV05_10148 [Exophiala xenobiotica]KIW51428.1 hypothetical protein PV05_10148 [Exophiala xenobiotica]